MKRYKPAFKQVIKEDAEEDKSIKMIKDLIDLDWEKDEDAQHQALAMIKGLVLADTKSADKFLTDLSTYTSKMNIEDYSGKQEEGCKKKPKKKGLKETTVSYNNIIDMQVAISEIIVDLLQRVNYKSPKFYSILSQAIHEGILSEIERSFIDLSDESQQQIDLFTKRTIKNLCKALMMM